MNAEQRPREKALRYGVDSLSDAELLAVILGSGTRTMPVLELASHVLDKMGGFAGIRQASPEALMKISGIREVKALQIQASFAMAVRSLRQEAYQAEIFSPIDAAEWFMQEYGSRDQEHFVAVYLDVKGRIIFHKDLFVGTLNESTVHPREIFREACLHAANSLVVLHNHPSGDCSPSRADIETTRQLERASVAMGIRLLDHLIVSRESWVSMKELGLVHTATCC